MIIAAAIYAAIKTMKGRKTPAVAYITRLIRTTGRPELEQILQSSPLRREDIIFILHYIDGLSYKELSVIYNKSEARIYQRKRKLYELLHAFLTQKKI